MIGPACVLAFLVVFASCTGGGKMQADPPVSVAIWDLQALGPMDATQAAMGELLGGQITERFEQASGYLPVERSRLLSVMEELNIGSSDLAASQTRLRLGRLVGARQMVFGAYQVVAEIMRIDIRLVDVASGRILKAGVGTAAADSPGQWLGAADQAADELFR